MLKQTNPLTLRQRSRSAETGGDAGLMKRPFLFVRLIGIAFLVLGCGSAVLAQGNSKDLAGDSGASQSSLTGAGLGGNNSTAANPGRADGMGNSLLGGRRPLYRLHRSDVVEMSFTVAPEFNQTLTVQPDGYVTPKDAGPVLAEGLTIPQFTESIRKAYTGYLHDPEAAVILKEFEHPYFVVGGEVGKPGKYELRSDTTVAEAVQIAGGFTPHSKHSQVLLFRRVSDDLVETRLLNVKKMLKQNGLKEDAHLQAGDMVYVPQNAISKISRFLTRASVGMYMNSSQF